MRRTSISEVEAALDAIEKYREGFHYLVPGPGGDQYIVRYARDPIDSAEDEKNWECTCPATPPCEHIRRVVISERKLDAIFTGFDLIF